MQFSSPDRTAVCTLASIALPRFVRPNGAFDFDALHETTKLVVLTADALLDSNSYPSPQCRQYALDTRALGIGAQGLADVFMACNLPFSSDDAKELNINIFETIYHAAYDSSCDLAKQHGPYPMYDGSPAQRGVLQHDMWNAAPRSTHLDFDGLRTRIAKFGLRNSMLTAQMPTASSARLLGNFDSIEPYTR